MMKPASDLCFDVQGHCIELACDVPLLLAFFKNLYKQVVLLTPVRNGVQLSLSAILHPILDTQGFDVHKTIRPTEGPIHRDTAKTMLIDVVATILKESPQHRECGARYILNCSNNRIAMLRQMKATKAHPLNLKPSPLFGVGNKRQLHLLNLT